VGVHRMRTLVKKCGSRQLLPTSREDESNQLILWPVDIKHFPISFARKLIKDRSYIRMMYETTHFAVH
jgi:hypothetical protein